MTRMYDIRELGRSAQGFERAWHVRCLCCVAECGGVGACPGDAMSAWPHGRRRGNVTESEEAILRDMLYDEESGRPLEYIKHDTNAHEDEKILALVDEGGLAWYGLYWLLVEKLARRKGNMYNILKPSEVRRLRSDLCALSEVSNDEIDRFLEFCAEVDLIDGAAYSGYGKVAIGRIIKNSETVRQMKVSRRLGGIKSKRTKDSSAK